MRIGTERKFIAYAVTTTLGILLVHAIAVLLRKSFVPDVPPAAYQLVWAAVIVMLLSAISGKWLTGVRSRYLGSLVLSVAAGALFTLVDSRALVPMMALPLVCPLAAVVAHSIARRLPEWLDGAVGRFPIRSALWVLLALLMVVQTARLSSWVTDPTQEWSITTDHPFFAQHMCMGAYIYAADLNRQDVDNVYDQSYYPGLNPNAEVHTTIKNFQPDDPYQYPPQFLLLPRLAIGLTDDFELIKVFWLFLQALFFGFIGWSVARFIGGQAGLMAAFLLPVLWISFPVLSNLQYGQFHLMSILMAVAAMIWFAQGRHFIGGGLLAFAVLSKAAPGILLIYLIARRRWREVGWTLGMCLVLSLVALAVTGPKPFAAFVNYQLPHLQNGTAFAFAEVWPDFRDIIIAGNQAPFAFIFKLDALGVPGMTIGLAKTTHLIYTLAVIALAIIAARINGSKQRQLTVWLVLLNLAALISKGAWGDYITIGTLWLLTFMVVEMSSTFRLKILMGIMWLFMFIVPGVLPLPGLENPDIFISLAGFGMLLLIGFNVWVLLRGFRAQPE